MNNPIIVKNKKVVESVHITGARNLPDNIKKELIDLEPLVRRDLRSLLNDIRIFLLSGKGKSDMLCKRINKFEHLLNLKGDIHERNKNNNPCAGNTTIGRMDSFKE